MNTRINFKGSFGEYFIMSIGLFILSVITLGLALPYWIYWSYKYFFTRMQVGDKRVKFTGGFGEYFIISLGLMLLSIITFGLATPYWIYWQIKYFFSRLEVIDNYTNAEISDKPKNKEISTEANTDTLFD
jgi:uncharacterized membrane protein YjgN (DUF898 family)